MNTDAHPPARKPGQSPRDYWRTLWRYIRVLRRERTLAADDCMIWGTGMVKIPYDGSDPRRVPPDEWRNTEDRPHQRLRWEIPRGHSTYGRSRSSLSPQSDTTDR